MSAPKLSIIVPIYNVEPYLRKCVESLLTQDLDPAEYEIILVDDGSTDGSGELADQLEVSAQYSVLSNQSSAVSTQCSEDSNQKSQITNHKSQIIKVLHQPNGGLSAARNTGIMAAKGDYVCFVDSDDYWEPNVLGGLMAQVERDDLDVLRFKWQNVRVVSGLVDERMSGLVDERYEVFNPNKSDPYRLEDYSSDVTTGVDFLNTRFGYACYA
ncbi:MAG: glycosyltransferase, partial [Prevotellaceae bacterium]|nr:glycosyltransferase [Candidatus Faecinaster equi]